jgi:hypothetical protein
MTETTRDESDLAKRHEEEDEAVAALAGGKSLWTARVSSRSAARSGQPLELAVDTTRLHFFDPASGQSIGHPLAAGAIPVFGSLSYRLTILHGFSFTGVLGYG